METLSRQWKYILLDFSALKDVGELSSKVLFADAGDREAMVFDVIEDPVTRDQKGKILHSEYLLGFKVGYIDDEEGGGRKVTRQEAKKSVLANKFAGRKIISSNSTAPDFHMSLFQIKQVCCPHCPSICSELFVV
jgi:hypothetical protein